MKEYLIQELNKSPIYKASIAINSNGIQLRQINNIDFILFFIFDAPGYNKTYFDHISDTMDSVLMESNIKAIEILALENSIIKYAKTYQMKEDEEYIFNYSRVI